MFAGYDGVQEHAVQTVPCDLKIFTDARPDAPPPGADIVLKDRPGGQTSPVLQNVWLRLFPFEIPELDGYQVIVYVDANVQFRDPAFVGQLLARAADTPDFDLMLSVHPWNRCLYREAEDSRLIDKYRDTDLAQQVATYRRAGFPANAGLYWNGLMVFNRSCDRPRVDRFLNAYWHEMIAYNRTPDAHPQGQVSLPYCLWRANLRLIVLSSLYQAPSIHVHPHLKPSPNLGRQPG